MKRLLMKNGENSIKQRSATNASKDLRKMKSRLEIIAIILANIVDLLIGTVT